MKRTIIAKVLKVKNQYEDMYSIEMMTNDLDDLHHYHLQTDLGFAEFGGIVGSDNWITASGRGKPTVQEGDVIEMTIERRISSI